MFRSLYDCSKAKVNGNEIKCAMGHNLNAPISLKQVREGNRLVIQVCQQCLDFDAMGPPIPAQAKGWAKRRR